ncbi:hypothetical protein [Halobacterium zhouii]|uniref:hypothetical protein n=1 Tax=Halobacterium zhouii TaxID=2902624 RepID=UPI001E2A3456|nr:hypothetical protein [Halobacterium zhouii]
MSEQRHTLLVVALVVVGSIAAVSGGAAAASAVTVDGEQADDGTVTVTVTQNGTAVSNATVEVEALNNTTYAGVGTYTTGENGTVGLTAPERNVTVELTAFAHNSSDTTTLSLVASTGNETDDAANQSDSFGLLVSNYVQVLQNESNMSGQTIADFVTSNNPGADHRSENANPGPKDGSGEAPGNGHGKPEGTSGNGHGGPDGDHGKPDDAGNGNGNGHGHGNAPGNSTESGDK